MCGRFNMHLTDLRELRVRFDLAEISIQEWTPRYNVAPSQPAAVVTGGQAHVLRWLNWGLVPHWVRDADGAQRPINARAESATDKPTFRDAVKGHRCIVPVTGYYEWKAQDGGTGKQPYLVAPRDGGVMALAGLWQQWVSRDGELLDTFAILTTDATGEPREIHHRMPLEVPRSLQDEWLSERQGGRALLDGLSGQSVGTEHLGVRPVSKLVNSPRNDGSECLRDPEPEPADPQLGLFD